MAFRSALPSLSRHRRGLMNEPPPEKIAELKEKFHDRELQRIEAIDGDEVQHVFIMTGPNRDEYRKFIEDMRRAGDAKPEDKTTALRSAVENSALAQIRWPDRDTTKEIFSVRPAMVDGFAEKLHAAAGGTVELRAKKL